MRVLEGKLQRTEGEMRKYRPKFGENRRAVRNVVRHLDRRSELMVSFTRRWKIDPDTTCNETLDGLGSLRDHISNVHIQPQIETNAASPPHKRRYICRWEGCGSRSGFHNLAVLRHHMVYADHIGSVRVEQQADILRDQLINCVRPAKTRRYSPRTKAAFLDQDRGSCGWQRNRAASPMPMPAARALLKWKRSTEGDTAQNSMCSQLGENGVSGFV